MSVYFDKHFERGFGTFPLKGDALSDAVTHAYDIGYRAYDTAQMYQNEADLGNVLRRIGAKRDEIFITTKVSPKHFDPEHFIPSVKKSLQDLGVEKTDMLLLHWPPANGEIEAPVKLLSQAYELGLSSHIGVSNFNSKMMREAQHISNAPIACNQVEFHPLLDQSYLLETAKNTGIGLVSYCSVARGEIFKYPLFAEIGQSHSKTPAQIALRWILQKGVALNTMSTKPQNIEANFTINDFELSDGEVSAIDELTKTGYRIVTADIVPWAPKWD